MVEKIAFPDYVVLPDTLHNKGVLQNATEFILYYHLFVLQNFFKGKKLAIIGEPLHVSNNRELLRLTLLGPTLTEYRELDPEKENPYYEQLYRESQAISLKDKSGKQVGIDGFVDFIPFKNNDFENEKFKLIHKDHNVYEVNGNNIDLNFTGEQIPPYDLKQDFIPITPTKFGFDVLGGGSGFSPDKPSSTLVLNYNSDFMLIDCPPYLEYALKARGISRNQIKSIFLSHIHDDHCNIFPLVLFHKRVKFLTTREIFWMACKKLSLMTMHDIREFYSYFEFVELKPYEENDFYGVKIKPHYTVHSIPTIGATFSMCNNHQLKNMVFVGDNKALPDINKLVDSGIVKEEKYQHLNKLYHDRFDLFVADGGLGLLHGDPKDSLESKSDKVIFLHMEKLPEEFNTTFTTASHGKRFTLMEGGNDSYLIKIMHILRRNYPGISEDWLHTLLNNTKLLKYNTGDVIIKQGENSDGDAFIILSGNVRILFHDGSQLKRVAVNQAGDMVGEMAVINQAPKRSASLVAGIPTTLCTLNGEALYSFLKSENRIGAIQEMLKIRSKLEELFRTFGFSVVSNQQIASASKHISVEKGETIVKQGEMGDAFYIILNGKFSVVRDGVELDVLESREIFGEIGSLGNRVRNSSVTAMEKGEVLKLNKKDMLPIIKSNPSLHFFINRTIKERGEDFIEMPD